MNEYLSKSDNPTAKEINKLLETPLEWVITPMAVLNFYNKRYPNDKLVNTLNAYQVVKHSLLIMWNKKPKELIEGLRNYEVIANNAEISEALKTRHHAIGLWFEFVEEAIEKEQEWAKELMLHADDMILDEYNITKDEAATKLKFDYVGRIRDVIMKDADFWDGSLDMIRRAIDEHNSESS